MTDKLGPYITKLMTTVIDFKEEQFVRDLAMDELRRLNVDVEEFIRKNSSEEGILKKSIKKSKKQLLQEDEKNVKNK